MPDMKKVKVVLNAAGTAVDAALSTVDTANVGTVVKQAVPFLRDDDTAIVNGGTAENLVQTGVLVAAAFAGDHFNVKKILPGSSEQ